MDHLNKPIHHNRALLCGTVSQTPQPSHTNHGQPFCRFLLSVPRLSGQCDLVPVITPQQLLDRCPLREGDTVTVSGQLRSFNNRSGAGHRLLLSVFAHSLQLSDQVPFNQIQLSGVVCKPPSLRRTPLGREICDILLAVNRRYGRADYLPCIAWGAVAQSVATYTVGQRLTVEGRVQSRTYTKETEDGAVEHTAYEVSIMRPAEEEEFLL